MTKEKMKESVLEKEENEKIHNFEDSLLVGDKGESMVMDFFEKRFPYPLDENFPTTDLLSDFCESNQIVDVSKNEILQKADIDFIFKTPEGKKITCELKTDTQGHKTGNMALELTTGKTVGCFLSSHAEVFMYLIEATGTLFVFDKKEAELAFLNAAKTKVGFMSLVKNDVTGSEKLKNYQKKGYNAMNYIVPLNYICERTEFLRFNLK